VTQDGNRILASRYQVGELIGRGGMAEVHIGHDTRLGRTVAIKILRSDLARDPSFQARFRREAQAAAALNHPAIVAVYDTGEDVYVDATGTEHHVPFIVMEYVEGHTVRDILKDGAAVPIEEAVEIVMGVLSALEYSHHAGIVHRDIKPANVMLTPTGAVKVMDFGIARAVADSGATMTQTQAVIGTAQYLSPEQARGEQVDARSDLYSTGCLLFELLTGRAPFVGDSPVSVAYQHVREAAPAPSSLASDVPEVLDRITLKALAKDREARYRSAAEFRADLEAAVRGGVVSAPPVSAYAAGATMIAPRVPESATAATQVLGSPATAATQAFTPGAGMPWAPTSPDAGLSGFEEEDEETGSRRWLLWTLVGVAVLAIVGIVVLLLNGRQPDTTTVLVPDVVGATEQEAKDALTDVDLVPKIVTEASDEVEEGVVIRTDPTADTPVEPKSEVTVYVSAGPDSVTVPDVKGLDEEAARRLLSEAGLVVTDREEVHLPGTPEGEADRTEPAAGETVPKGAEVVLFVASGNVELPDLKGMTEDEAKAKLRELKLIGTFLTEETDEVEPGQVVRQDRVGLIPYDSEVTVYIAIEPEPQTVVIPNSVIGRPLEEAQDILEDLGLRVRFREEESDQTPGTVLYAEPGVGSEVEPGTTVMLYIAKEPAPPPPGDEGEDEEG